MEWVIIMGLVLLVIVIDLKRAPACEIETVYRSVFTSTPFEVEQTSETEWVLSNGIIHALYTRTDRPDHRRAETFNLKLQGYIGGLAITSVDGCIVAITHNGRERSPSQLQPDIQSKLIQITQRLRREL